MLYDWCCPGFFRLLLFRPDGYELARGGHEASALEVPQVSLATIADEVHANEPNSVGKGSLRKQAMSLKLAVIQAIEAFDEDQSEQTIDEVASAFADYITNLNYFKVDLKPVYDLLEPDQQTAIELSLNELERMRDAGLGMLIDDGEAAFRKRPRADSELVKAAELIRVKRDYVKRLHVPIFCQFLADERTKEELLILSDEQFLATLGPMRANVVNSALKKNNLRILERILDEEEGFMANDGHAFVDSLRAHGATRLATFFAGKTDPTRRALQRNSVVQMYGPSGVPGHADPAHHNQTTSSRLWHAIVTLGSSRCAEEEDEQSAAVSFFVGVHPGVDTQEDAFAIVGEKSSRFANKFNVADLSMAIVCARDERNPVQLIHSSLLGGHVKVGEQTVLHGAVGGEMAPDGAVLGPEDLQSWPLKKKQPIYINFMEDTVDDVIAYTAHIESCAKRALEAEPKPLHFTSQVTVQSAKAMYAANIIGNCSKDPKAGPMEKGSLAYILHVEAIKLGGGCVPGPMSGATKAAHAEASLVGASKATHAEASKLGGGCAPGPMSGATKATHAEAIKLGSKQRWDGLVTVGDGLCISTLALTCYFPN